MSEDKRPDVAKKHDEEKHAPQNVKESLHNAEATLGEGPAPDPSAQKRSRVSDS